MSTPRAKYGECYVNNYLKGKKRNHLNLLKELIYCTPVSTNPSTYSNVRLSDGGKKE